LRTAEVRSAKPVALPNVLIKHNAS
jgi:hypothetical protein